MAVPELKSLRKLLRTLESQSAFENLPRELRGERSDRAVILMCASYVDAGLKGAIWLTFPNRDAAAPLFDDQGPLHSFSAKVKVGEALMLFGQETRRNLDIIQTVRNAFAHSLLVISFATPEVAQACDALTVPDQLTKPPYGVRGKIKFDTHREKFISASVLTVRAIMYHAVHIKDEAGNRTPAPS